jgi:hypothetical protein
MYVSEIEFQSEQLLSMKLIYSMCVRIQSQETIPSSNALHMYIHTYVHSHVKNDWSEGMLHMHVHTTIHANQTV